MFQRAYDESLFDIQSQKPWRSLRDPLRHGCQLCGIRVRLVSQGPQVYSRNLANLVGNVKSSILNSPTERDAVCRKFGITLIRAIVRIHLFATRWRAAYQVLSRWHSRVSLIEFSELHNCEHVIIDIQKSSYCCIIIGTNFILMGWAIERRGSKSVWLYFVEFGRNS